MSGVEELSAAFPTTRLKPPRRPDAARNRRKRERTRRALVASARSDARSLNSAIEERAAATVDRAQSDVRIAKHHLALAEKERERLSIEAAGAKSDLLIARTVCERVKAELAETQDVLATIHVEHSSRLNAERIRFTQYTEKQEVQHRLDVARLEQELTQASAETGRFREQRAALAERYTALKRRFEDLQASHSKGVEERDALKRRLQANETRLAAAGVKPLSFPSTCAVTTSPQ